VTTRHLQKWHGAGNDFLVDVVSAGANSWTSEEAAALCDRHLGIGADGLLVAEVGDHLAMTLYNADGSLAEMSGNGVRCLVGAVVRARNLAGDRLEVATSAGVRTVSYRLNGSDGWASVTMGRVTFAEALEGTLGVAYVGNPHVVVRDQSEWSDFNREQLAGQLSEKMGGANVEFVTVDGMNHVTLRVIERGVGWTLACGTGSCAVAAILALRGEVASPVVVANPGGELTVSLARDEATLAGPMRFVGDIEWTP
jgi:diaminopimelate epimerase